MYKSVMRFSLVCFISLFLIGGVTFSESFSFPSDLKVIESEAFAGAKMPERIELPSSLTSIGEKAFFNCTSLKEVVIPDSVTSIGSNAFPAGTVIYCSENSYADNWAYSNGFFSKEAPRYYALLIGQTYEGSSSYLPSCIKDANAFSKMLEVRNGIPYNCTVKSNLNVAGIKSSISEVFAGATEQDVCLFYYSGHGASNSGSLVGYNSSSKSLEYLSLSDLKYELDKIPATKILILDSCYSGQALFSKSTRSSSVQPSTADLDQMIVNAFTESSSGFFSKGTFTKPKYYVITAARYDESSQCTEDYSVFTRFLLTGSGYSFSPSTKSWKATTVMPADTNGDSSISHYEAYKYAYEQSLILTDGATSLDSKNYRQHAQCYPDESSFVLWKKAA